MKFSVHTDHNSYIISLEGHLDSAASVMFDKTLQKAIGTHPEHLWIDCSKLTHISFAGLDVLTDYLAEMRRKNIALLVFNASFAIRLVFDMLGLNELVPVVPSRESARVYCKYNFTHWFSDN